MINVAVYGYGQVGKPLVEQLLKIKDVRVLYIVTKSVASKSPHANISFITDHQVPLNDKKIDFIFECISDYVSAETIAQKALKESKVLISCNKKLWAMRSRYFKVNLELALLNSLACNSFGKTDYPEINISLSNIWEIDPEELYRFRGCTGECAAKVMIKDFLNYSGLGAMQI